jgi:hypothetical protein
VTAALPTRAPILVPGRWTSIAGLTLAVLILALAAPVPAPAQDPKRAPSAGELWQQYPLQQGPSAEADGTAVPATPQPPAATPVRTGSGAPSSGGAPLIPLIVVCAVLLALVAVLLRRARRGAGREWVANAMRPLHRTPPLAAASGPRLEAPVRMSNDEQEPPPQLWRSRSRQPSSKGVPPPDPNRAWTAEVTWDHAGGTGRFRVVASGAGDASTVQIVESAPLRWPPTGPTSVQAMSRAADELEASMLAAGWTPLPPREAWYAKRFAWQPVAAPTVSVPDDEEDDLRQRRRFAKVAWPEGSEGLWRCELQWRPSYRDSRFEAVVFRPGHPRGQPTCESMTFKRLLIGDPDAAAHEYRAEIDRLTGLLEAAGWEPVGTGTSWFSRRFVWRGDTRPPKRLEDDAVATGRTSE